MIRYWKKISCGIAIAAMLTGCAQLQSGNADEYWLKSQHTRPSGRVASLLLYAEYVRGLSATDYARELDHVRQLAAKDKSEFRQLQYVLALSAPGGDVRRAQQVMDTELENGGNRDPELSALVSLVDTNLAERRRLEGRIEAGLKRADELEKRAGNLEKKMEAVKDIEKNMIGRDKGADKP